MIYHYIEYGKHCTPILRKRADFHRFSCKSLTSGNYIYPSSDGNGVLTENS